MKIGVITYHFVTNQGAVLQCWALKTYLESLGHTVEVINYRPHYHAERYAGFRDPFLAGRRVYVKKRRLSFLKRLYMAFLAFFRCLKGNFRNADYKKSAMFRAFTAAHLRETRVYRSLGALKKDPPACDVYISGSDQLWNPDLLEGRFDPAYFLDFGDVGVYRMTYAVSAKEHFTEAEKRELAALCAKLDDIGMREENADIAETIGRTPALTVDPTLLNDSAVYKALESPRLEKEPYLFVYGFQNLPEIDHAAREIAEARGLKIVNGCPHRIRLTSPCKKVYDYTPGDFLSYIANADYVVSNSFHALAFSLIYRKEFVVVPHTTRSKRMVDLLAALGAQERVLTNGGALPTAAVDYDTVLPRLETLRAGSAAYLAAGLEAAAKSGKDKA